MLRTFSTIFLLSVSLCACSFLLPKGHEETSTAWHSYSQIETAYNEVIPNKTTLAQLEQLGFDPKKSTNISIENFSAIQKRFDPLLTYKNLPPEIALCIKATSQCRGYYIDSRNSKSKRTGNAFLDVFRFKRITETKGWKFQALFVLIKNTVVFKLWNGSPKQATFKTQVNPLGPLQDGVDVSVGYEYNLDKKI